MRYTLLNTDIDTGLLLPLVSAHAKEMYGEESNLDLNHFYTLANAGFVRVFVASEGKRLVGYAVYIVHRDFFKAHIRQAECVAIYVIPEYRGSSVARRLLRFGETYMSSKDGIRRLISTTSCNTRLKSFYTRMGYKVSNIQVTKELF